MSVLCIVLICNELLHLTFFMFLLYFIYDQVVKLKAFSKFENTSEALEAATLISDSKPSKGLRKFLRAHCDGETLAVADSKLGNIIKEKLVCCYLLRFFFTLYQKIWSDVFLILCSK